MPRGTTFRLTIVAIALLCATAAVFAVRARSQRRSTPAFVGSAACAGCHTAQYTAWRGSQHAVAMQEARPGALLGRFDGTRFTDAGVTSTFFSRDSQYFVNTVGADGKPHDFAIKYAFGVSPLQQYLVELEGGHVQALPFAWDDRPQASGGQRWFSLSAGIVIDHADEFHWTGRQYNWNYMCADCHSTAVRERYDERTDAFHTAYSEISVGCEGCHGPGSRHATWARYPSVARRLLWRGDDGLPARLTERAGVHWSIDSATGNARRSTPRHSDREIETCAQCHARRSHIADDYTAGARFMDYYVPLLLTEDRYYPDGQQRDEVYTYGSFVQSKMYAAGVTCADCHDPHTQKLRLPGNQVCAQCHSAAKYDAATHHFHSTASAGSRCVSCHLPDTTYMQIDPRHDHSIRIPRPDLSVTLGVPNACNRCHTDRDARWAVAQLRARHPNPLPGFQRFAGVFSADDRRAPGAVDSLARVANDSTQPWFVRASALVRLGAYPGPIAFGASRTWSRDPNSSVRLAALQILDGASSRDRMAIAAPLLVDSVRAVRQGAAWVLAPVAESLAAPADRRAFAVASAEFVASQRYNADRASSRIALAAFFAQRAQWDSASAEFRAAVRLSPRVAQDYAALATLIQARR